MPGKTKRRVKYPLGTLIAYGPDNTRATKLVAAIHRRPDHGGMTTLHRWISHVGDIREDPAIGAEIAAFFAEHGVKDTTTYDRIFGCPHEEGIDYPMGRTCPHCPFWANIDRHTHEPIVPPVATMSPEEILAGLSRDTLERSAETFTSADAHRETLVASLLAAIDRTVENPEGASDEELNLFGYAVYLLAKWREPRAFPYILRWLSLRGEKAHEIGGDIVTQDGKRILASVYDGNLEPIKALILDREANEFCRGQAVEALGLLAAWAEVPRQPVVELLLWLACEGLERTPSVAWNDLASICADIKAVEVFAEIRRAFSEDLIEDDFMDLDELDEVEAAPTRTILDRTRDRYPPIGDVADETSWWSKSDPGAQAHGEDRAANLARLAGDLAAADERLKSEVTTYRAPPKVGRNDPCPCGSGKKYKKCCGK